jgi:hypothetical protein
MGQAEGKVVFVARAARGVGAPEAQDELFSADGALSGTIRQTVRQMI